MRFILFCVCLAVILLAGWYFIVGKLYDRVEYQEAESYEEEPWQQQGAINLLLIGNDARETVEGGRSDAMILLSINSNTRKLHMISLLRDMYVEIPGHGGNRLNAAYAFGGPELLMETVEQNFDIDVNRYVMVNFEAFVNLVDAAGGVELELSGEEIAYVNAYLVEYNMLTGREEGADYLEEGSGGLVHLNGAQALAYSRNRYIGMDFGRTQRQRKILAAVMKELPGTLLADPVGLADGILPNLTTNLTQKECFGLSFSLLKLPGYDLEQGVIPLEGTYRDAAIRGMAVLEIDFEANKEYLHNCTN